VGIAVKAIAPAIFTDANGTAIAVHSDGTRVSPGSPARPSETILLWTTGLGPTASGSRVVADIRVWFEGTPRMPVSCLGSGAAGYYRVTVQMPETVSGELTALRVQADGVMSPAAALPSLS
jgi:uncharacterized protein (TIGR03437 family)